MDVIINSSSLKELRTERSWTQEDLAEAAGVHPRTVQRVEAMSVGSKSTLRAFARALDVEIGQLQRKRFVEVRLLEPALSLIVWTVLAVAFGVVFRDHAAAFAGGLELLFLGAIVSVIVVPMASWGLRDLAND